MTSKSPLYLALFLAAACATPADEGIPDDRQPTSLGKADLAAGSCAPTDCGGQSPDGCWCDDLCVDYGDCCDDASDFCGVDECVDDGGCEAGEICVTGPANDCVRKGTCGPMDAAGVGLCEMFMGYVWDGSACVGLSGCSCTGADCDQTYFDRADCDAAHAHCSAPDGDEGSICGGFAGWMCDDGLFCDYGAHCGSGDQAGVCTAKPDYCTTAWAPVCGCDGETYGNTCTAHANGVSIVHFGECEAQDSCEDNCGGQSADGSCWCDAWCSYYGDCCDDLQDFCD